MHFFLCILYSIFLLSLAPDSALAGAGICKLPVSERYFAEGLFDDYHEQLLAFVRSEIDRNPDLSTSDKVAGSTPKISHFIQYILSPVPDTISAKRAYHETMIQMMRALIAEIGSTINQGGDQALFLGKLAEWMYTGVDLWPAQSRFISEALPLFAFEADEKRMTTLLSEINGFLQQDSRFGGHADLDERDAHLTGDLPFKLFTFQDTQFIRTSIVINTNAKQEDALDILLNPYPEFKQFLRHYVTQGKRHLYVNLTQMDPKEIQYSHSIQQIENDPEIRDALMVVRLDRNSAFYHQLNMPELLPADLFMQQFLQTLHNPFCYNWSNHLDMEQWDLSLQRMVSEIYDEYFENKDMLTIMERLQFIDLMNLKIVLELLDHFRPASANISCKDSVDRGPSLYSSLYLYGMRDKDQLSFEERRMAATLLFAPALIAKNRMIHTNRLERLVSIIPLLSKVGTSSMPYRR